MRITTPTAAANLPDHVPGSTAKITASGFEADHDYPTKCATLSIGLVWDATAG